MTTEPPANSGVRAPKFLKTSQPGVLGAVFSGVRFPGIASGAVLPIRMALLGDFGGCGMGRGCGAAINAIEAAPDVKLLAIAELLPNLLERMRGNLASVPKESCFSGLDAYEKALHVSGVNYVIIATPAGLRPRVLRAAVEAGKHVFIERPVAVDAPGVRSVIESGEIARKKGLSIVAGTQRRHQPSYVETIKRIQDGAIGEIAYLRAYWNQGSFWYGGEDPGKPALERAIRNWYHFRWLSGDHIVDQHTNNLDVCNWVMGNQHPIRAYGQGGRQTLGNKAGHIWDHFAIEYEYEGGTRLFSQCRQISGTDGRVAEAAHGSLGQTNCESWIVTKEGRWRFPGRPVNAYEREQADLIQAIRTGEPLNEARTVAESTFTAIMGREAAYSGRVIEWDQLLSSNVSLVPERLEWDSVPDLDIPIPGQHIPA